MSALQVGAQLPDLRKEHHVEHLAKIAYAARAAGATLESDHPFHAGHVAEAPEAEGVLDVGELFAQLVEVPVRMRRPVDGEPGGLDAVAGLVGLRPVALKPPFLRSFNPFPLLETKGSELIVPDPAGFSRTEQHRNPLKLPKKCEYRPSSRSP